MIVKGLLSRETSPDGTEFWGITLVDSGDAFDLGDQVPESLRQDGLLVNAEINALTNVVSIHGWGMPADLISIEASRDAKASDYHDILYKALNESDKQAAAQLLDLSEGRADYSRYAHGLLSWIALNGPLSTRREGETPSPFEVSINELVSTRNHFDTPEAAYVLTEAMKAQGDLVEWEGLIDIWGRSPEDVRQSLETPEPKHTEEQLEKICKVYVGDDKVESPKKDSEKKEGMSVGKILVGALIAAGVAWAVTRKS